MVVFCWLLACLQSAWICFFFFKFSYNCCLFSRSHRFGSSYTAHNMLVYSSVVYTHYVYTPSYMLHCIRDFSTFANILFDVQISLNSAFIANSFIEVRVRRFVIILRYIFDIRLLYWYVLNNTVNSRRVLLLH